MSDQPKPAEGGSTIIDKKGKAVKTGGTLSPLDPAHPEQKAKAAAAAAPPPVKEN